MMKDLCRDTILESTWTKRREFRYAQPDSAFTPPEVQPSPVNATCRKDQKNIGSVTSGLCSHVGSDRTFEPVKMTESAMLMLTWFSTAIWLVDDR